MVIINEINSFYIDNYKVLLNCCKHIINKCESYHSFVSCYDLLNTSYIEMVRKKDKVSLNIHYFYTFAKNVYRYICYTMHDDNKVSIKSDDNENGYDINNLEYKDCDNYYLNDELTDNGKRLLEIVKGTKYYDILECVMNYDNIDTIQKKTGLPRKKITNYIGVMVEIAKCDNINIHSINHFLMMKKNGFDNCVSKKTISNNNNTNVTLSLNLEFYKRIKKRCELLKQSMPLMIFNDLNNEYKDNNLCVLSNCKRGDNGSSIRTTIYIDNNILSKLKERSEKFNNSLSKQLEFDLMNYYRKHG